MTIGESIGMIRRSIESLYGPEESAAIADLLAGHITGFSRMELAMRKLQPIADLARAAIEPAVQRLLNHEPIQYITGEMWFSGMPFYVDRNVLIPRPETDELVAWIIANEKDMRGRLLDVGTGSGCIAVAIKKNLPHIETWGCDISMDALEVARLNADRLSAAVDFLQADMLDHLAWRQFPVFDVIVSNPPYIPFTESPSLAKHVREYEPAIALFVSDDRPFIFYERVMEFAADHLSLSGRIYFEIHENRLDEVRELASSRQWQVTIKKDMQGKPRMLRLQRQPVT